MRLLSLFGLNARIRRLRIAAAEGALAAEDRVQLLRMAWEDEKQRLKLMLLLSLAVLGLTTVTVALLSVAVVVNYWDTPYRVTAAWSVAGAWIVLWLAAAIGLLLTLRNASNGFLPARQEFERDWAWAQEQFGLGKDPAEDEEEAPRRVRRPVTREELLARMELQRLRIATMQGGRETQPASEGSAPPPNESAAAAALRIARAHPVATGVVAAAAVVVIRPKRLLRWVAVIAPVLWRMR
ncbi:MULTISPECIES: phage holin family protein [unclassified Variovorax]|uniref:phage holin family protein n=1 Tax=unclassified Variovorax TaxID=663243 RepID=UPI000F7E125F|nr:MULTISPECIES: phage holin family protein [unclassified Variovorax]RSZ39551.1 phage holin family protein [Variovorax sp. 553]RSZ40745.1 phage holin family protein [Variovorax sp. 679]